MTADWMGSDTRFHSIVGDDNRPLAATTLLGVGSEEAPIEGLASVRHSNGTCSFPHSAFMNGFARSGEKGSVRQGYLVHQRVDLLLLDLRTSNDRIVSSKRDV